MSSGSATAQGSRPYQEDRWLCHAHPPDSAGPGGNQPRFSIAAVYDGHGGAAASEYSVQNLHAHLCSRLPPRMSEQLGASGGAASDPAPLPVGAVESVLAEAFAETEAGFMAQAMAEGQNDGTTATVVVVEPGERRLFTAQLGDSRAVLGFIDNEETTADGREEEAESDSLDFSRLTAAAASAGAEEDRDSKRRRVDPAPVKMGAVRLTQDHKPQDATERQRVEAAGGEVVFLGCWRVSHPDCTSYLACSRAIGDLSLKVPAAVVSGERHTHPAQAGSPARVADAAFVRSGAGHDRAGAAARYRPVRDRGFRRPVGCVPGPGGGGVCGAGDGRGGVGHGGQGGQGGRGAAAVDAPWTQVRPR